MATKMKDVSSSAKFNWRIEKFSELNAQDGTHSRVISVGNHKWEAVIYPKGKGAVYDHLSLYLKPINLTKPVVMEFSFAVTSQTDPTNTFRHGGKLKCRGNDAALCGWPKFMHLTQQQQHILLNDTCVIAVEVTCWEKEEDSYVAAAATESDPNKEASDLKRQKIKDERK